VPDLSVFSHVSSFSPQRFRAAVPLVGLLLPSALIAVSVAILDPTLTLSELSHDFVFHVEFVVFSLSPFPRREDC